jgi:CBS domain containing-hemolysin-like protein
MNPALLAASAGLEEPPTLDPWLGLALGLLLVAVNGFFVAAEFALVKVRPTQLEPHAARGDPRGRLAKHMVEHLDAYLSASQLGITLASLGLGWIGEPAFAWLLRPLFERIPGATPGMLHSITLAVAFVIITALHIILGEVAPKSVAIQKAEATSLWVAIPMFAFFKLTYPAIWVINKASNGLLRLIGVQPVSEEQLGHSEEELRLLLGGRSARLSKQKRELLDNVFELSHRTARQVMVPRADVTYLSLTHSLEQNIEVARQSEYTRYPLCKEHLDDMLGLVHIKDLFYTGKPPGSLEEIRRDILFVPESLTLDRLLRRMRHERSHMAAVVDEYGGVSGIVTLENVIEEIVGQIQDEFDRERPELVKKGDDEYRVAGIMLVADLEDALGVDFSERDEDTVAGVVLSELGRSPRIGDRVKVGRVQFEVLDAERHRIETLLVKVTPRESVAP